MSIIICSATNSKHLKYNFLIKKNLDILRPICAWKLFTYTMYTTGVIQVHVGHHTARHQNCSRSFDEVDTTRLLYTQRHHHFHHLKPQHRQPCSKNTQHASRIYFYQKIYHIHLNLCVCLSCTHMTSILNYVLQ